jgi:hypothetical protein
MAEQETRTIRITNAQGDAEEGVLSVTIFSSGERVTRAAKVLLTCWALAAAAIFIPLAHFVLVPTLVLAGPVMAYMRYRVVESVEAARGRCPTCKKDLDLALDAAQRLPLWTYCPTSNDPIQLIDGRPEGR